MRDINWGILIPIIIGLIFMMAFSIFMLNEIDRDEERRQYCEDVKGGDSTPSKNYCYIKENGKLVRYEVLQFRDRWELYK